MICSVAWEKITYNSYIDALNHKTMKATAIGLWYIQIPYNYLIDPYGNVVEPKVQIKNGKEYFYIWEKRKQKFLSSIPKLTKERVLEFKKIFVDY